MHKRLFTAFLCFLLTTISLSGQTKGCKVVLNDGREFLVKEIDKSANVTVLRFETGEMIVQTLNIKEITQIDFDAEKKIEMEKSRKTTAARELARKKWEAEHPEEVREPAPNQWESEQTEETGKADSEEARKRALQGKREKTENPNMTEEERARQESQQTPPYDYQILVVLDGDERAADTLKSLLGNGWEIFSRKQIIKKTVDEDIWGMELSLRKSKVK